MDVDRDAAAVVFDRHRVVGVDRHRDRIGEAGQRLVDGVVDDLVHHVVQAGDVIGIADVHARPLPHGVEAFEDLDVLGRVVLRTRLGVRLLLGGVVCHFVFLSAELGVGAARLTTSH